MSKTCSFCDGSGTYRNQAGNVFLCPCSPQSPHHEEWLQSHGKKVEKKHATQRKRRKKAAELVSQGYDEMNLTERALVDWGRGPERGSQAIIREWTLADGTPGGLIATTSDIIGLPTPADLDMLNVLITLSHEQQNPDEVRFDGAKLMDMLMRPKHGSAYKQTRNGFDRWSALYIQQWAGWWDKNERKRVATGGWHMIEEWHWPTRQEIADGADPQAYFRLGKPLRESLRAGNIKRLNLDTYWSIESAAGRFLYRYVDRHLYGKCKRFTKPNDYLYGTVLGLRKQNHSPVAIAGKLERHTEDFFAAGIEVKVGQYRTTFFRSEKPN